MIRFEEIEKKVERHHSDADMDLLRRAYLYSAMMHKEQVRASGEPYLSHPLSVASLLADMKLDVETVCTGLLHDVVEDTLATLKDISDRFGPTVAHLVDGVTKISNLDHTTSKEDAQAESLRKMMLAMADDVRVVLVKLADRLHNMQTLHFLKPEKRKRIAQETLDVYAPIAHRLGMSKIRAELEDLAFQSIDPDGYKLLKEQVESHRASTEAFLEEVKARIAERLTENHVPFIRIEGRIKRLYSIHLKLQRQKIPLDKVYDMAAVRIIVPEPRYCYYALGVMHQHWKPFQDRIKDFIANPRANGYKSLHTSVIGEEGQHFEVQIRTEEMHRIAEEGIAAHWKYKEGKGQDTSEDETMKWLRKLVESQQDVDARDFVDIIKEELPIAQEVYALTPKGRVVELPSNATPIDFAYTIHTKVGDQCTGAKVNGRIAPLNYKIQNGDTIEILTSPNQKPNRDWLKFVVTTRARNKIKHYVAQRQREEAIEVGRKLFEKEALRLKLKLKKALEDPALEKYRTENGYPKLEDMYAAIGYGKLLSKTPLARLIPPDKLEELDKAETTRLQQMTQVVKRALKLGDDRIAIKGVDNILVYRAPCCNPIRGEDILGYITRGKGVGVHARRCKNVAGLMINKERMIEVTWVGAKGNEPYAVTLLVRTEDRTGQLAALTKAVAEIKTDIRDARTDHRENGDGTRLIEMTVEVLDLNHFERVRRALRKVQGVIEVERAAPQI